jgi:hypothetical protein
MEAIRGRRAAPRIAEADFAKEISQSANAEYVRGVKRRRLDSNNNNNSSSSSSNEVDGRSFLETRWELELGMRKREHADWTQSTHVMGAN